MTGSRGQGLVFNKRIANPALVRNRFCDDFARQKQKIGFRRDSIHSSQRNSKIALYHYHITNSLRATYTVFVKRNAQLIPNFFLAPLGEGGQILTTPHSIFWVTWCLLVPSSLPSGKRQHFIGHFSNRVTC